MRRFAICIALILLAGVGATINQILQLHACRRHFSVELERFQKDEEHYPLRPYERGDYWDALQQAAQAPDREQRVAAFRHIAHVFAHGKPPLFGPDIRPLVAIAEDAAHEAAVALTRRDADEALQRCEEIFVVAHGVAQHGAVDGYETGVRIMDIALPTCQQAINATTRTANLLIAMPIWSRALRAEALRDQERLTRSSWRDAWSLALWPARQAQWDAAVAAADRRAAPPSAKASALFERLRQADARIAALKKELFASRPRPNGASKRILPFFRIPTK
jgi:hypothetical protein